MTTAAKVFPFTKKDYFFQVPLGAKGGESLLEPSRFDVQFLAGWFRLMDEGNFRYDFRSAENLRLEGGGKFKYLLQLCPQRVANRRPPQVRNKKNRAKNAYFILNDGNSSLRL